MNTNLGDWGIGEWATPKSTASVADTHKKHQPKETQSHSPIDFKKGIGE